MKCSSATNYVLKNALRILCATAIAAATVVATTTTILAFNFRTIYPHFPVSIYLSLLYHFLFTLNFIFTLYRSACLIYCTVSCYCAEVFFHHVLFVIFCHRCYSFLHVFPLSRSPTPNLLRCFVLCCHSFFKLIASSKNKT